MRRLSLVLLVTLALPVTALGSSLQATHYVSPSGSDSNPGTEQEPWRTVEGSLAKLEPGDTLLLREGVYEEAIGPVSVPDGTEAAPILVTSHPGEQATIRGYLQLLTPDHLSISDVDVEHSSLSGGQQLVRISGGNNWVLQDSEISGAHSTAGLLIDDGSQDNRPLGRFRVAGNCIHDTAPTNGINRDHNVYVNATGSLDADGLIERNLLFNAPNGRNLKLGPGSPPQGGAHNVTVRHNTAYNAAQNLSTSVATSNIVFERNIVRVAREGNFWAFEMPGSQGNVARENVVGRATAIFAGTSGSALIADGGGNLNIDPRFDAVGCQGFHPAEPAAQAYGRWAP